MVTRVGNRPKALVVDDDPETQAIYLRRLTIDGYEVAAAADAAVALELVKKSTPDVIFVHLGRNGSGSTQLLLTLRAADDTRHIPVAVLDDYYDPGLEGLGLAPVARENW
jgi:CheY-like chemotaxis protein